MILIVLLLVLVLLQQVYLQISRHKHRTLMQVKPVRPKLNLRRSK